MFNIKFNIDNPFTDRFANLVNRSGRLTENKAWEFEILKANCIVNLSLDFTTQCDHAGLQFAFGLLGYEMCFKIYDTRHWDYQNKTWIKYE
jgi:hypothetical protein